MPAVVDGVTSTAVLAEPTNGHTTAEMTSKDKPVARIVASASSFPPYLHKQEDIMEAFIAAHRMLPDDESFTRRVFGNTMMDTCSHALPKEQLFKKFSKNEYVAHVKPALFDLGMKASRKAILEWGGRVEDITHIVWGTMTGTIHAPTMDIYLAGALGLREDIQRLSVESMGCLTGFRCLALAEEIATSKPGNTVLVVVCDIRSALGNQLTPHVDFTPMDKSNIIVSAMFRDSGGAAIVTAAPHVPRTVSEGAAEVPTPEAVAARALPQYDIIDHRSMLIPETGPLVKYQEYDDSVIHLYIDRHLPDAVFARVGGMVEKLLAPHGITPQDCCYLIHTGGPKILKGVQAALNVPKERLGASWNVMQRYGNLSGSSNLVVLDHGRRLGIEDGFEAKEWAVCMSFGPGVGVEALLLRQSTR